MEFVNDTTIQARFDYYDNHLIQQQVTLQGAETREIADELISIPGNIAVTLFENGFERPPTLHGELTINSSVAGVIQNHDGDPVLKII